MKACTIDRTICTWHCYIADSEVSRLVADLAKLDGTTKTEALRRLLRKTLDERRKEGRGARFHKLAMELVAKARREGVTPVTKEEMDDLWGMDELDRR